MVKIALKPEWKNVLEFVWSTLKNRFEFPTKKSVLRHMNKNGLFKTWFPAFCMDCGWRGPSHDLIESDSYLGDCDIYCPLCGSDAVEEIYS